VIGHGDFVGGASAGADDVEECEDHGYEEGEPRNSTNSAPPSHNLAHMPSTQQQTVLKHRQIHKGREPHNHQKGIKRQHNVFVEIFPTGLSMVGLREGRVEEQIREDQNAEDTDGEDEQNGGRGVGVDGVGVVPGCYVTTEAKVNECEARLYKAKGGVDVDHFVFLVLCVVFV